MTPAAQRLMRIWQTLALNATETANTAQTKIKTVYVGGDV